jgi:hypothetical protein
MLLDVHSREQGDYSMRAKGFFDDDPKLRGSRTGRAEHIDPCEKCGLYRDVKSPKMKPHGKGKKRGQQDWKSRAYRSL